MTLVTPKDDGIDDEARRLRSSWPVAAMLAVVFPILVWLIATTTLPYAIAETSPETALWLNPSQPRALLELAERRRKSLSSISNEIASVAGQDTPSRFAAPKMTGAQSESLRAEIQELCLRVLAIDPLNARAMRMLAEVQTDPETVRQLMAAAYERSRRESIAAYWLMHHAHETGDFDQVLEKADVLLRSRGRLSPYVMPYLVQLAENGEARTRLADILAARPPWRESFLNELPRLSASADTASLLFTELVSRGSAPENKFVGKYLTDLARRGQIDAAYAIWLQFMPVEDLKELGFIYNGSFEKDLSHSPFDWTIPNSQNVIVDLISVPGAAAGNRVLQIDFGVGRAQLRNIRQTVVLGPGSYKISGKFRGTIVAKRGLRWRLTCVGGSRETLAKSDEIKGNQTRWVPFEFVIQIPENKDCAGQQLELFHDARSASEQFISGKAQFDDIHVRKSAVE